MATSLCMDVYGTQLQQTLTHTKKKFLGASNIYHTHCWGTMLCCENDPSLVDYDLHDLLYCMCSTCSRLKLQFWESFLNLCSRLKPGSQYIVSVAQPEVIHFFNGLYADARNRKKFQSSVKPV